MMSDTVEEPTWNDGKLPEQAPSVGEDGAWSSNAQNAYDALRGKGSRGTAYEGGHSGLHDWAQSRLNDEDHQTGVRVSGTDADGNPAYNARASNSNSGMNMLHSATAPVTAGVNTYQNFSKIEGLSDWDGIAHAVTGLAGDVAAVHGMVEEYWNFVEGITDPKFDPVQWLAGTLIDFLIQLFQPLEDLVGLVSGNESRMRKSADMWVKVSEGAQQVGEFITATGEEALADWVGQDGDAARARVGEAGQAVSTMGFLAIGMNALLLRMADLAKLLRQDIVDLIAKGVSWLLTRVLPQVAASVATFGATAATAVASGIAKVASLVMKALDSVAKVLKISEQAAKVVSTISEIITKIKPVLEFLRDHKTAITNTARVAQQVVQ
ncbi:hypothetical protein [Glycomyces tarimensis]